jgi:T4 recombination endonuclease VII-like protein
VADMCPNCGEAGAQMITHFGQCLYCGKRWDLTSGDYIEDMPTFPGGGVTVGAGGDAMTTTASLGTAKSDEAGEGEEESDLNTWTKAELQATLDAQGIEYPSSATKSELIALFE